MIYNVQKSVHVKWLKCYSRAPHDNMFPKLQWNWTSLLPNTVTATGRSAQCITHVPEPMLLPTNLLYHQAWTGSNKEAGINDCVTGLCF